MSLRKSAVYQSWLKKYFLEERWHITIVLLFNLFALIFTLVDPLPIKLLADSVFSNHKAFWPLGNITNHHVLLFIAAGAALAIPLLSQLYNFITGVFEQKIELGVNLKVEREILLSILRIPTRHPDRLGSGDYQYRLNDLATSVAELAFVTFVSIARSVFFMIVMLLVILWINPLLAGAALLAAPFLYITVKKFGDKLERQTKEYTEQQSKVYDKSADIIDHSRLIQADVKEEEQTEKFIDLGRLRNRYSLNYTITASLFSVADNAITGITTGALVLLGGYLVFDDKITFGSLLVFVSYMAILYQPLHELNTSIGDYKRQIVQIRRLYEIIVAASTMSISSGTTASAPNSTIEFKDVEVKFKDNTVYQGLSFVLPAGRKLAIMGPSGSGKSTLLDLLPRFSIPNQGTISIGGVDIKDWNIAALRRNIAMVDQNPQLISDSVLANVIYGVQSNPNDQMLPIAAAAAQKANALGFIEKLPENFFTMLGPGGVHLSGGQAQRICLARAIMKGTPILLLDEPTSALDSGSRKAVVEAIKNTMANKTVIIATHDIELLKAADHVAVIKNQQLEFVKTMDELMAYLKVIEKEAQQKPMIGELDISSLI